MSKFYAYADNKLSFVYLSYGYGKDDIFIFSDVTVIGSIKAVEINDIISFNGLGKCDNRDVYICGRVFHRPKNMLLITAIDESTGKPVLKTVFKLKKIRREFDG